MKWIKQFRVIVIAVIIFDFFYCQDLENDHRENDHPNDSIYTQLLIQHLRSNFDDIHDVSMRYHHKDHNLNGVIQIDMLWNNEMLDSARVIHNETGDKSFGEELIKKIRSWRIAGIKGPFEIILPFRVKIVGMDEPGFNKSAIVTGKVVSENNSPIHRSKIEFINPNGSVIDSARTNREGVFVRTLIPPGEYTLRIGAENYLTGIIKNILLKKGEHRRELISLKRK